MTNEELKKKIIEIILDTEITGIKVRNITGGISMAKAIADALIAVGIGDVSELKNHRVVAEYSLIPGDGNSYVLPDIPLRITQLYSGEEVEKIVKERDEYKHRAEVAERALVVAVRDFNCGDCPYLGCSPKIKVGSQECISRLCAECKRQAEKELAELKGGKNE